MAQHESAHVCKSNLNHRENLIYVCRSLTVLFKYNYYTATLTDTSILARLAKKYIRQFLLEPGLFGKYNKNKN